MKPTVQVSAALKKKDFRQALIVAPMAAIGFRLGQESWSPTHWASPPAGCRCGVRAGAEAADRGFVLSDHADWEGLNHSSSRDRERERIFVTHGYTEIYARWLREQGYEAAVVETMYGEEETILRIKAQTLSQNDWKQDPLTASQSAACQGLRHFRLPLERCTSHWLRPLRSSSSRSAIELTSSINGSPP
jgi:hypothetical protein